MSPIYQPCRSDPIKAPWYHVPAHVWIDKILWSVNIKATIHTVLFAAFFVCHSGAGFIP
ncbi:hypothetical protein [Kaarinaea lacus]